MPKNASKSTNGKAAGKPAKPYKDFPLFPHPNGQWCRKICGKPRYFGRWAEPEKALALYLEHRDELYAGRTPRKVRGGLTVADLCNRFLTLKQQLVDGGELAKRTFDRYFTACGFIVAQFGKARLVDDLVADDFQALRATLAKRFGPVALGNEIQMVRSVFRYGYEAGLIEAPVRFGPGFKKPSAKTLRQNRAAGGPRMFTAAEIRKALKHATPNMKAMFLLAINGALGNSDLAEMPLGAADLESGWLVYARAKTAIGRRIPLWPETCEAIRAAMAQRREPADPADAHLLFIGKRGESYVGGHKGYRVNQEAARVFKRAGIKGRTFYDLRRTFQTIAEGAHDLVAVQAIMGHAPPSGDMSSVYRQRIDDERLKKVADHVRAWVWSADETEAAS